ncbi:MAG: sulfurtransferase TusA family protein [Treponemataceae bacterium]
MKTIDARGLACPAPVVKAKKALAGDTPFEILVNTEVAKENVRRFAESQGAKVTVEQNGEDYKLAVSK